MFDKRNMKLIVDWGKGIFFFIAFKFKHKKIYVYRFIYIIVLYALKQHKC